MDVRFVSDPNGRLHKQLNAGWLPRFYLVDASLKLVGMQTAETNLPDFVMIEQGER